MELTYDPFNFSLHREGNVEKDDSGRFVYYHATPLYNLGSILARGLQVGASYGVYVTDQPETAHVWAYFGAMGWANDLRIFEPERYVLIRVLSAEELARSYDGAASNPNPAYVVAEAIAAVHVTHYNGVYFTAPHEEQIRQIRADALARYAKSL